MSLIDQAKQRTLETAIEAERLQRALDAWSNVGVNFFDKYTDPADRETFLDGVQLMRNAIANKMFRAMGDHVMFFEDCKCMKDVLKERIEKYKEGKHSLMPFLNKWGRMPTSWPAEEEKQFQKEFNELHETK
jgi:hypothetical protein